MSRLEELIAELCPDGVEYVPLSSVCARQKGISITAGQMKERHSPGGEVCVFAGGNTKSFMNVHDLPRNAAIRKPSIIVKSRGNIGFEYYDKPFTHKNELWSYSKKSDNINIKFIYYYLESHKNEFQLKAKAGKLPQISTPDTDNYKIPLVPLAIQEEIVRILDTFTELTTELTTELAKRKEQYQYYQDYIFNSGNACEKCKLIDLCGTITTGKLNANAMDADGKYPFFTCDANPFRINTYAFDTTAILISGNGSQIGHTNFYSGKFNAYQRTYVLYNFINVMPKFLFLYLKSHIREYIIKYAKKGSVPYITLPMLQNFEVPVPSREEQARIVAILDRFDALCNDLTSGLPAEIEARQKQYEYYRDKLLTFKEAV